MVAAALIVLVASGVLVAAATYPDAVVRAGIVRSLADADPLASSVAVSIDVRGADADSFDSTVRAALADALGGVGGETALIARSDSYAIVGNGAAGVPPSTSSVFTSADDLDTHAHLIRGSWPAAPTTGTEVEAAISEAAAATMGLDAGATASARSLLDPSHRFPVQIVGVFAPNDPADPYWGSDPLLLQGTQSLGTFTTVGPLFVTRDVLVGQTIVTRGSFTWRAIPAFDRFTPDNVGVVSGNVAALTDRLRGRLGVGQTITVHTGLPALLAGVSGQLAEARSGSALVAGQLVVLAMYALIFVAALVVGQRRATTSLIRSRGASSVHLIVLAVIEGALIAGLSAALGLPLGIGLATLLTVVGPGARSSVVGSPGAAVPGIAVPLSASVVELAAIAGLVALVGLTLPTIVAVGPLSGVRRSPGRQRAAALVQRSRLDLGLAGLAGVALWQLRGRSDAADISAAPLAVIGPAVGLLAAAILLLRVVPIIGRVAEAALVRGRTAGGSVVVRAVTRRSVAAARPALLVAISAAIGLFAVGYESTWETSQRDQVAFAVGADVRGEVSPTATAIPAAEGATYRSVPGITAATPLVHEQFTTGSAVPRGVLLGIVPDTASGVIPFRSDLASQSYTALLATLTAARPDPATIPIPDGATAIRVRADVPTTAGPIPRVGVALVVRSADGVIERLTGTPAVGTPTDAFVVTLPATREARTVLAVELQVGATGSTPVSGTIGLAGLDASAAGASGPWTPLDASAALRDWSLVRPKSGAPATSLPPVSGPAGDLLAGTVDAGSAISAVGATIVARATSLADAATAPLPGLADPAVIASTNVTVGDVAIIRQGFAAQRQVSVAGTIGTFPGLTEAGIVVADLGSLQLAHWLTDGTIPAPDEWRFSITPGSERTVIQALGTGAGPLQGVRSAALETSTRLNDPIVVAIAGMLALSAAAAAAFAVIGFATAAWASARNRLGEFAVGRALGLTSGQVRTWLVLELAFPTLIGVAWGIGVGIALDWMVLPAVTHAPGGGLPQPPALVVVPLDVVAAYLVGAAALVLLTGLVLARTVERTGIVEPLRGEP